MVWVPVQVWRPTNQEWLMAKGRISMASLKKRKLSHPSCDHVALSGRQVMSTRLETAIFITQSSRNTPTATARNNAFTSYLGMNPLGQSSWYIKLRIAIVIRRLFYRAFFSNLLIVHFASFPKNNGKPITSNKESPKSFTLGFRMKFRFLLKHGFDEMLGIYFQ